MARKPLVGTVAENVLRHGTGGLNVDACRIAGGDGDGHWSGDDGSDRTSRPGFDGGFTQGGKKANGRWPANVCLDEEAAALLDEQSGNPQSGEPMGIKAGVQGVAFGKYAPGIPVTGYGDTGGTSRFFYVAKASRAEREEGCLSLPLRSAGEVTDREDGTAGLNSPRAGAGRTSGARNFHPTVKPIALMRWLVRLVTPPGGHVLDPFTGSGTMGIACALEDREFTGIEIDPEYARIAQARLDYWRAQPKQMVLG